MQVIEQAGKTIILNSGFKLSFEPLTQLTEVEVFTLGAVVPNTHNFLVTSVAQHIFVNSKFLLNKFGQASFDQSLDFFLCSLFLLLKTNHAEKALFEAELAFLTFALLTLDMLLVVSALVGAEGGWFLNLVSKATSFR